jgi:hypothetical protein
LNDPNYSSEVANTHGNPDDSILDILDEYFKGLSRRENADTIKRN